MKFTYDILRQASVSNHPRYMSFTKASLAVVGLTYKDLTHGWLQNLMLRDFPEDAIKEFIANKTKVTKATQRRRAKQLKRDNYETEEPYYVMIEISDQGTKEYNVYTKCDNISEILVQAFEDPTDANLFCLQLNDAFKKGYNSANHGAK
jgi:hypothetical protein